jgi:DNA polymerase
MLSNRQVRMLELLDKKVSTCQKCKLCHNGTAIPIWTPHAKYVMIGEAPGLNEVRQGTPFVGKAGVILRDAMHDLGFKSIDFLIINSVQCRPVVGNRNGKPTERQLDKCQEYVRKYIKVVNPEKILCLGNYSKYIFNGTTTGILGQRGTFTKYSFDNDREYPVLFTVHPAYCIYQEEGIPLLKQDLELFRETKIERHTDWLLSEDDFKI